MITRGLVTGGTGLLGKALLFPIPSDIDVVATYYGERNPGHSVVPFYPLDISDADAVNGLFDQVRPDVVIHTAAIGSVDYAECNREEAWAVNVDGTRHVAEACRRHGARLVFISSNAVFDGKRFPYSEEDAVCPINYYGELKVEGERVVRETLEHVTDVAIIRPILLYRWPNPGKRGNLATLWVDKLEEGRPIQAVDDVWSKPLQVESCAEVCWAVIAKGRSGTYHVAGADHVTLYQYAQKVAEVFGFDQDLVTPVPSAFFPQLSPRPKDTSFVTDKMERELGVRPVGLAEGLACMKAQRLQAE